MTHGFVVDGVGKKISKSKGNYIDPLVAMKKREPSLLRLWVAGEDYRDDVRLSPEILKRLADSYRKVRNTVRFLLGNLFDFEPTRDAVPYETMLEIDRYALAMLFRAAEKIRAAYASYTFHAAVQTLIEVCTIELSAFYLDILKDRLYAYGATSLPRRSAQTALYIIARDLLRLLSPVFCFTSDEAWQHLPHLPGDPVSVHLSEYAGLEADVGKKPDPMRALRLAILAEQQALIDQYAPVREVRRAVNAALEGARRQKPSVQAWRRRCVCYGIDGARASS